MIYFNDSIANFILGVTLADDKVRRRKPTRLESYSHTSYRRLVSRLGGAPRKDYTAAIRSIMTDSAEGCGLQLVGASQDITETMRDLDMPPLEKAVNARIHPSEDRIGIFPAAPRWTSRLALWLACDLIDRGQEKRIQLALPPREKEDALRLLQREVFLDEGSIAWLGAMAPDWTAWAEMAGFQIVGTKAVVAPYRAEVVLASEILSDVCDVIVAQRTRKCYTREWRPDARHRLARMKEFLLRLGFSECEIVMPNLADADTVSRISALERECKGKPYPHQFFAEAAPNQTLSSLAVWQVSAENDPNVLAGTISRLLDALQISCVTRPDELGAKLLFCTPEGKTLARLTIAPEKALKAAASHYKLLVVAEIFPVCTQYQGG